jgi:UDP-N-acetylglucosamine 1-carboxyvinyltransferase
MEQFIITGPAHLRGSVTVSGSKNAALPIIAASLLIKGKTSLQNVPKIKDVLSLLLITKDLGVKHEWSESTLTIDTTGFNGKNPDPSHVRNLRASILLISPCLVHNKKVTIPHPGGCLIGSRPFDYHVTALQKMGATFSQDNNGYTLSATNIKAAHTTAEFSVTGTENIIMAAVLSEGTSRISLAAAEPHVQDLCKFLNSAGAKISGIGTHDLIIEGVEKLQPVSHTIVFDQIESGTFAIAMATSKGEGTIHGFVAEHQQSLLSKFDQIGVNYKITGPTDIEIKQSNGLKAFKIKTEIYPGFPTDLQAPMAVLATQCEGTSEIYETIFEGRLGYINELSKMGASCVTRDAHQASITGPTPLFGTRITSFDLRAGATLIIAAICAQGESRLDQIEIIDRGYEGVEDKFKALGANIRRIKLKEA